MSLSSRVQCIDRVFVQDQNLKKRIFGAIEEAPHYAPLFEDIANYCEKYQPFSASSGVLDPPGEPASKKRKLENGVSARSAEVPFKALLKVKDVSFSMPQRKKLDLHFSRSGGLRGVASATGAIEFESASEAFQHALKLPIPEKAQKQYNFCLLPGSESLLGGQGTDQPLKEPVLWTMNAGPAKSYEAHEELKVSDSEGVLEKALSIIGLPVTTPDDKEFASTTPESHRKNETAYHVKAFKGSKDGYLFFLSSGIFFGYKKPLLFFPFDIIESTSYTSVLQRTFNLTVAYKLGDAETHEIEFSMLDQSQFAGIDAYIKRHGLQDASMAEARRAKKFSAKDANAAKSRAQPNGSGGETVDPEADQEDQRTELEKVELELDDEEDAQEEDFEPSDEDSDGSGSDVEEDEDEVYEYANTKGRDLVKEELGSEAEDVSVDEEEDEAEGEGEEGDEDDEDEDEDEDLEEEVVDTKSVRAQARGAFVSHQPLRVRHPGVPAPEDDDQL